MKICVLALWLLSAACLTVDASGPADATYAADVPATDTHVGDSSGPDTNLPPWSTSGVQKVHQLALGGGYANDLVANENHIYIANGSAGVAIVDITAPATPALISSVDTSTNNEDPFEVLTGGEAKAVAYANGHIYVADGLRGLTVISVSGSFDHHAPGNCLSTSDPNGRGCRFRETRGQAHGIALAPTIGPNYVLVADGKTTSDLGQTSGLAVVELLQPGNPGPRQPYDEEMMNPSRWYWDFGDVFDVAVVGDYAYVTHATGLGVVDMTDPNPYPPSTASPDWMHYSDGIDVSDQVAYIAATDNGLALIDVANPMQPRLLREIPLGICWDVKVSDNVAYVVNEGAGLAMVEVSDPTAPMGPDHRDVPGTARAVTVAKGHVFVAAGAAGLVVFRIAP